MGVAFFRVMAVWSVVVDLKNNAVLTVPFFCREDSYLEIDKGRYILYLQGVFDCDKT